MADRLEEIKARAEKATPGPWGWFGNVDNHDVYLATHDRGRQYVMRFVRWGMQKAQPVFYESRSGSNAERGNLAPSPDVERRPAQSLARYEVCPSATSREDPRVYRGDLVGLASADAAFLADSRADVDWLIAEVEKLRALADEYFAEAAEVPRG